MLPPGPLQSGLFHRSALTITAIYSPYKTSVLIGDANANLNIRSGADYVAVSLTPATYTFSVAHQFFNQVGGGTSAVGTDQQISSAGGAPTVATTATGGTFTATDVLTWTALTGATVTQLVLYRHNSGAAPGATWRLVCQFDSGISTLPLVPNSGNVTLTWNPSGIFTISTQRLKRDIRQIGNVGPFALCEYRYLWDRRRQVGLIAEDVEKSLPKAVHAIGGVKRVNYPLALSWAMSQP